jgi:hypothetical protein
MYDVSIVVQFMILILGSNLRQYPYNFVDFLLWSVETAFFWNAGDRNPLVSLFLHWESCKIRTTPCCTPTVNCVELCRTDSSADSHSRSVSVHSRPRTFKLWSKWNLPLNYPFTYEQIHLIFLVTQGLLIISRSSTTRISSKDRWSYLQVTCN